MTKFTKEQLTRIIDSAGFIITALSGDDEAINAEYENNHSAAWDKLITEASPEVVLAMARQLLASMEQEPVCHLTWHQGFRAPDDCEDYVIVAKPSDESCDGSLAFPVYAAPQLPPPAVVPDEVIVLLNHLEDVLPDEAFNLIDVKTWNNVSMLSRPEVYRAAMLQGAEPVSQPYKLPDGWKLVPVEPTAEMLASAKEWTGLTRTAEVLWGKMLAASPQPQNAQQNIRQWIPCSERMPESKPGSYEYLVYETLNNQVQHDYWNTPDTDYIEPLLSSWNHYGNYVTHWMPLPAAPQEPTKCWCHTCRPVTMFDMRFVVCPECGNKRCPHANDHRNACTGSNEPGQEGSAYPAAPQQEVK